MYDQQQSPPMQQQGGYPNYSAAGVDPRLANGQPAKTNGLAIAGLILAFIMAPVGLILSVVGLIQAGKRGQKGKALAVIGIVVSLLSIILVTVVFVAAAGKVSTLADPGCTAGKAAILDNAANAADASNPDTMKTALQATITGLNSAASQAKHDNVRDAAKALADDYTQLLNAVNTGTPPDSNLTTKLGTDGNKFDSLCSLGS
jgi:hypothetical protein